MANTEITLLGSKSYRKAIEGGENGKECAVCGKQTNETHFVEETSDNLGFFPVGPECFKKLAKAGYNVLTKEQMEAA